jgi:outer membrane protein
MLVKMKTVYVLAVCLLLLSHPLVRAEDLPVVYREAIEARFPGAVIHETEPEMWNGQRVMEVELTDREGVDYEVYLSEDGEIQHIAEEKGLPLIGGELTIGIAVQGENGIYKDTDSEIEPAPFLLYENGPFAIQGYGGIEASYRIYGNDFFEMGVLGSLDFGEGYDKDDSTYFEGMDELEDILYGAGVFFGVNFSGVEAGVDIVQDISGEHDGQEVGVSVSYTWMVGGFQVEPELSLNWLSEKTVDYRYGVSEREARVGRPAYSPGSSFQVEAELLVQRQIFGNFSIIGLIGASSFGSDITDSPLVDEDYEIEGAIGIGYAF